MLYEPNIEKILDRYQAFWALENHDRPLVSITAPKDRPSPLPKSTHQNLMDRWCDVDFQITTANIELQNTYRGCEALPIYSPNLGPDLFAACYGTPLVFGEDTSWSIHHLKEPLQDPHFMMNKDNFYYRKIIELSAAASADAKDKYLVGITDLHPGADALAAMRGPEELCFDSIEAPEFIRNGAMSLFEGFKDIYEKLYNITTSRQGGSTNWMGIWHPSRWYVTSCDFCCLISPDMFEEMVIPELEAELSFLDASIFHLDGPGALRHLDRLLEIDKLKGIQWVYGAGQPSARHWLDILQKIQRSGKLIQVFVEPDELGFMLENLAPEGVNYCVKAKNETQALELTELVDRFGRRGSN